MEKYKIKSVIGKGKFGTVYLGENKQNHDLVAIKTEAIQQQYRSIKHEVKMMNYLFRNKFEKLPMIYWYGNYQNLVCLVMTYYESSLTNYLETHTSAPRTPCFKNRVMLQCIDIFEYIHKRLVLHRDIKPTNFMIKGGDIHLIDFGLATFYLDEDGEHKPNDFQTTIIGTPKYVSYYNHAGYTISRRDEMISLGYMYMAFFGVLPWQNISIQVEDQGRSMIDILHPINVYRKKGKSLENLFDNVKEPEYPPHVCLIVTNYMKYCYSLDYEEEPNYYAIKQIFIL